MQTWIEPLGWMLIHSVWMIAVIVGVATVVSACSRRRSANARYVSGCVALTLSLATLPAALWWVTASRAAIPVSPSVVISQRTMTVTGGDSIDLDGSGEMIGVDAGTELLGKPVQIHVTTFRDPDGRTRTDVDVVGATSEFVDSPASYVLFDGKPTVWQEFKSRLQPHLAKLVVGWLIGVLLVSLRPLIGWQAARRLRRSGLSSVPQSVKATLDKLASRLGVQRAIEIFQSSLVQIPCVIGAWKPIILLPATAMTGLSSEQLDAVLAHELAHIRRHDFLVNVLQTLVETLLFYHPAIWWLARRVRQEREHCCDDMAVSLCDDVAIYAKMLVSIEHLRGRVPQASVAAGGGSLVERIRRLVPASPQEPRSPGLISVIVLGVLLILAGSWQWSSGQIVNGDRAGRGAPDPASTVGLQNSTDIQSYSESTKGDLRSSQAAGSEDPRRVQEKTRRNDWPMWGGSSQRNHVAFGKLPAEWDLKSGMNVAWSAKLGSQTYSSPVIGDGKVFIGTNNASGLDPQFPKDKDLSCLVCFDQQTGKLLWQYASEKLPSGRVHDWPQIGLCSTACVERDRMWVVTNRCEVVCLDTHGFRDGENDGPFVEEPAQTEIDADVVWKFDLFGKLGVRPLHQAVSSITIVDGVLLLNTSNGPDETYVKVPAPQAPNFLALDAKTGRVVWQDNSAGESIVVGGSTCSCSGTSPAVGTFGDVTQAIFAGREGWLYGFDFADLKRGKTTLLWKFDCNPKTSVYRVGGNSRRNTLVSSPVVAENRVFIATGRNPEQGEGDGDLWCIDPTKRGDLSSELVFNRSFENGEKPIPFKPNPACDPQAGDFTRPNPNSGAVWHYAGTDRNGDGKLAFDETFHRSISSPAIHDGLLFIPDFSGLFHCVDARTGQGLWTHDLLSACWSSCVIADGHVLIGDEDGELAIFKAARTCQPRHGDNAPAFSSSIYGTPALAGNTLFIASHDTLCAIREPSSSAGRGSPDPALDPTAGLPNSDEETNPPNNANGDLRSKTAAGAGDPRRTQLTPKKPPIPEPKPKDSEVAFVQATPTPDDEQRLVDGLRRSLPEGWVVERRFGGYWIDRRRRVFGKHFRETPDVILHFSKELDVPETPPMEGEVSSESLGPCRFGYCMAAIREDFRSEWPAIRQRIQNVLPMADPATTQSDNDSPTGIAVAGRLLFEDGRPVAGALVGPMFRKKSPLGDDGRFKLRVAPEWSRFRIHLLDANGWPSPRQWPRQAEHKGEVLDVMLPRTEEPFAICHLRLDRTKLHAVKLLWKGESVAARVTVQTYPSGNWLSVGQALADGERNLGGRPSSLSVARTLDVMLRQGETLTIPDVAPGDGTLRIVPIKSKRTLLWNLFGDERDERLEHDPAQVGSVEFRITGAVEADAQESPLGFMLSRMMPRSGFGLGSAFYNPSDPYRLEFDPKAESYRVSNLQPGSYHVMLMPEDGTSSPPVMFTIAAGQTEKIDLPTPKPARSARTKEADKETNPTNNANGDLRSNPAAESGDPRRTQQPQSKESRALFQQWQRTARTNGNIPGGTLGPLVRVMRNFLKNNPTHEGSPKFAELLKRMEVTRDWSRDEAVKLLDEVAAIYPSLPEWVESEPRFTLGGAIVTGQPLPDELKNAPWGEAQPNGLRVAWLLEPRALKYRLNTPLKSRILFHNSGKNSVVFRALTWNQSGSHKAHDADGKEINIVSTYWTTIPRTIACRLAPGEFLEVTAAGIGVGANKDNEDWRGTRVGSWIEAQAGDEVTFIPAPVSAHGKDHDEALANEPVNDQKWWLQFIEARLSHDLPLPDEAAERTRLLDRAVRELFGNAPTADEIAAFVADREPTETTDVLARRQTVMGALAKRLANRSGFVPFSGSLQSGSRKFLVLPVDPDAAKKPRTAKNPGQYPLGGNATFVVTRRPIGERIVNEAHIAFAPADATKPAPREPHKVPLPDGYDTWAAAWMRGGTVLWVLQKGMIRSYDFINPAQVKETQLAEPDFDKMPKPILEALRGALDVSDAAN